MPAPEKIFPSGSKSVKKRRAARAPRLASAKSVQRSAPSPTGIRVVCRKLGATWRKNSSRSFCDFGEPGPCVWQSTQPEAMPKSRVFCGSIMKKVCDRMSPGSTACAVRGMWQSMQVAWLSRCFECSSRSPEFSSLLEWHDRQSVIDLSRSWPGKSFRCGGVERVELARGAVARLAGDTDVDPARQARRVPGREPGGVARAAARIEAHRGPGVVPGRPVKVLPAPLALVPLGPHHDHVVVGERGG